MVSTFLLKFTTHTFLKSGSFKKKYDNFYNEIYVSQNLIITSGTFQIAVFHIVSLYRFLIEKSWKKEYIKIIKFKIKFFFLVGHFCIVGFNGDEF